jgi:putative phage-type endonuclease
MTLINMKISFKTIYDDIINIINDYTLLNSDEIKELTKSIYYLTYEYIMNNILHIMHSEFDKNLTRIIYDIFKTQLIDLFKDNSNQIFKIKIKLLELIQNNKKLLYSTVIPPRSYKSSFIRNINYNINYQNHISDKITALQNTHQPIQRSEEWYIFRHNILTASSIWKVFGSHCTQNQLIYEKCKPYTIFGQVSLNSPLHWGQKYEPISIEFYKTLYDTEIGDFGCIKHSKYPFIGASPDGINIQSTNKRFGRMLEIKNVVSREITGIPKLEYWIQMQIQMETCNLNECDFLETKFIEYESHKQFLDDGSFTYSADNKPKGIIILFYSNDKPHYEYAPLYCGQDQYNNWEKSILEKNADKEWIQNIFWKLETYSNVLVLRNKLWFNTAISIIESFWNTIVHERVNGYDHRAPNLKKRTRTAIQENKCYISVDKL